MSDHLIKPCTAFSGLKLLLSGPLAEVAIAASRKADGADAILVFDDETGRIVDLDLRGTDADILNRLADSFKARTVSDRHEAGETSDETERDGGQRGRGRPRLGVVAREVTLLPRQWEWLAAQPGGSSAALRRLVDEARKAVDPRQRRRAAQEAAYRFMHAVAGDLPGYEEATRALFADDRATLGQRVAAWPEDVRAYALRLAAGSAEPEHS
ncbi:MAG: DUF2239 family protein [Rhizobiaceae bacterium]|nr:DUF2239 family protein [Rhizobiaceae bacterium]